MSEFSQYLSIIDEGGVIFAPTQRSVRYLTEKFLGAQKAAVQPPIYTLNSWLTKNILPQLSAAPTLLTAWQSGRLWRQALQTVAAHALWSESAMVADLQKAFYNTVLWELDWQDYNPESVEVQLFQQVVRTYLAQRPVGTIELVELYTWLQTVSIALPPCMGWHAFEEDPPALATLKAEWAVLGVVHRPLGLGYTAAQVSLQAYADEPQEWWAAAVWAKAAIEGGQKSVAIVVPTLAEHRPTIEAIFTEVLHPELRMQLHGYGQRLFNISKGVPLLRLPFIQQALEALKSYFQNTDFRPIPVLLSQFAHYLNEQAWMQRALNSMEYQYWQRWQALWQSLLVEGPLLGEWNAPLLLQALEELSRETEFQPQSFHEPIQILGVLEAAGLSFEAMFVTGLTQDQWPARADPSPFIPYAIQVQHQMPHADATRQLDFAQRVFKRFIQAAPQVVLSHATTVAHRATVMSPLLHSYGTPVVTMVAMVRERPELEWQRVDTVSVPFASCDYEKTYSVRSLQLQSDCPIKAFLTLRVEVPETMLPTLGLNPLEFGSLVHKVLYQVGKAIQSGPILEVSALLQTAYTQAWQSMTRTLPSWAAELEELRVLQRLAPYVAHELTRQDREIVALEQSVKAQFAGLAFSVRFDRVDRTADGAYFILDYKTGMVGSLSGLMRARPQDVQFPLYFSLQPQKFQGFMWVGLARTGYTYKGMGEGLSFLDPWESAGIPDAGYETVTTQWRHDMQALAEALQQGHWTYTPRDGKQTCQRCHLQRVCRVVLHAG